MERRLTPFEPAARAPSTPRRIATFLFVVGLVGVLPGLCGFAASALFLKQALATSTGALEALLAFVYFVFGFAQLAFYNRRRSGEAEGWRFWWTATYLHNLVSTAICVAMYSDAPHLGALAGVIWFASLTALSVVAFSTEARTPPASRRRGDVGRPRDGFIR